MFTKQMLYQLRDLPSPIFPLSSHRNQSQKRHLYATAQILARLAEGEKQGSDKERGPLSKEDQDCELLLCLRPQSQWYAMTKGLRSSQNLTQALSLFRGHREITHLPSITQLMSHRVEISKKSVTLRYPRLGWVLTEYGHTSEGGLGI